MILLQHVAVSVLNPQDSHGIQFPEPGPQFVRRHWLSRHVAAIGQHAESVRHVYESHLSPAQGQAQAVVVPGERIDPHAVSQVYDVSHSNPTHDLNRCHVDGASQPLAEAQGAVELPVIVLRCVRVRIVRVREGGAHVHNHGSWSMALEHRLCVGEHLEGRSRLSLRQSHVDLTVYLPEEVVEAADHGENLSRGRLHAHQSSVRGVALVGLEFSYVLLGDVLSYALKLQIQCGVDLQSSLVHQVGAVALLQQLSHIHHEMRRLDVEPDRRVVQYFGLGCHYLLVSYVSLTEHGIEHQVLPNSGLFRVGQGRIGGGRVGQRRQHSALGQAKVLDMLAVIGLRRRLRAVGHVPEEDGIQVPFHDLILAVPSRGFQGKDGFLDLPGQSALSPLFRGYDHILDQ